MVPRAGIEPATCPLGGGRAIHCATEAKREKETMTVSWLAIFSEVGGQVA